MEAINLEDTMNYLEEEAQRERDAAMGLVELAHAVSSGCECSECRELGQWVPIPKRVPEVAVAWCPFGEPTCTDPTHRELARILAR